nr:DUF3265 domain-containing protein [Vibrio vulnificus]
MHVEWHFWYEDGFVGERGLRNLGISGTHPLKQRYDYYMRGLYVNETLP